MQAGLELINAELLRRGIQLVIQNSDVDAGWRAERLGERKIYFRVVGLDGGLVFHFGDWRDASAKFTMHTHGDKPSAKTARELKRLTKELEKEREGKALIAKGMVEELFERWRSSDTGDSSDYLEKKNLKRPEGVVVRPGVNDRQKILVVPMFDASGEFWNVQQIFGNGRKLYQKNARKKGLMHVLGGPGDGLGGPVGDASAGPVYVGEGFATCLAAWEVTQHKTYVSFDVKNLEAVVQAAVKRFGSERVVILADFDGATYIKTGENPGMLAAQKLALKYRVRVAVPVGLEAEIEANVDFADLGAAERGEVLSDGRLVGWEELRKHTFVVETERTVKAVAPPAAPVEPATVPFHSVKIPANARLRPVELVPPLEPTPPAAPRPTTDLEALFPSMADGFFVRSAGAEKWSPDFDGFSLFMRAKYSLKAQDGFAYAYSDGFYHLRSTLELKSIADEWLRAQTAPAMIANFVDKARMKNFTALSALESPEGMINLANGCLDVRTLELKPHTPERFFKYKLPHAFEPGATCPRWLEFLGRTFEGDQALVDLSAEIFGYVLLGGHPFLHKAFLLLGEGRNGKGVYLDVMKRLIGASNYSAIPLSQLDRPFSVVNADGKLANIVTEVTTRQVESEAFKTAVAGEELVAAKKYCDEYSLKFQARMVFAANRAPYLADTTTGAHEKFCVIPFNRYVPPSERIGDFAVRYLFPEISGVMNWALDGLARLMDRGSLPDVEAVREQGEMMRRETDSVFDWFKTCVVIEEGEVGRLREVKITDLYPKYEDWCMREKIDPVKKLTFSKKICAEFRKTNLVNLPEVHGAKVARGNITVVRG